MKRYLLFTIIGLVFVSNNVLVAAARPAAPSIVPAKTGAPTVPTTASAGPMGAASVFDGKKEEKPATRDLTEEEIHEIKLAIDNGVSEPVLELLADITIDPSNAGIDRREMFGYRRYLLLNYAVFSLYLCHDSVDQAKKEARKRIVRKLLEYNFAMNHSIVINEYVISGKMVKTCASVLDLLIANKHEDLAELARAKGACVMAKKLE